MVLNFLRNNSLFALAFGEKIARKSWTDRRCELSTPQCFFGAFGISPTALVFIGVLIDTHCRFDGDWRRSFVVFTIFKWDFIIADIFSTESPEHLKLFCDIFSSICNWSCLEDIFNSDHMRTITKLKLILIENCIVNTSSLSFSCQNLNIDDVNFCMLVFLWIPLFKYNKFNFFLIFLRINKITKHDHLVFWIQLNVFFVVINYLDTETLTNYFNKRVRKI